MPRVRFYKKNYMVKDLKEFIIGRMRTLGLTQEQMGKEINISQSSFSQRLNKSLFSYGDLLTLFKKLNATDEEILRLMKV